MKKIRKTTAWQRREIAADVAIVYGVINRTGIKADVERLCLREFRYNLQWAARNPVRIPCKEGYALRMKRCYFVKNNKGMHLKTVYFHGASVCAV